MHDVNNITICRDTYKTQEDFENAIKKAIMVLLDNEYIMTVRYDEPGIVCIDYDHGNQSYGDPYPYWLSPTEWERLVLDDEVDNDEKYTY